MVWIAIVAFEHARGTKTLLYHATFPHISEEILENGFKESRNGTHGRGVYFTLEKEQAKIVQQQKRKLVKSSMNKIKATTMKRNEVKHTSPSENTSN